DRRHWAGDARNEVDVQQPVLEVDRVSKSFARAWGPPVNAVTDVTLSVDAGETVTIVGESGSGKSTLARLALGMISADSGRVQFAGRDLARLAGSEVRRLRSRLTAVFQEPLESLNPRMKIGSIIEEPLQIHHPRLGAAERKTRVLQALAAVALNEYHYERFPN